MKARIGLAPKIIVGRKQDLEKSREIFLGETRGLFREARTLVGRRSDQIGLRAANAGDEKVAEVSNGFAAEVLEILPVGDEAMDEAESALGGLRGNGFDEIVENAFGDDAEKFADLCVRDLSPRVGDGLFEKGEAVAQAAFRGARENGDGSGIDFKVFGSCDALDFAGDFLEGERAELEKLGARFDCFDEIFGASGSENEDDALGRLFESFQQSV